MYDGCWGMYDDACKMMPLPAAPGVGGFKLSSSTNYQAMKEGKINPLMIKTLRKTVFVLFLFRSD